ncbi:hypothetical protein ACFJGW_10065 [Burkholderiaceae bacterium UC74_6]
MKLHVRIFFGALAIVVLASVSEPALRWMDIHWWSETLKDTWGRVRYGEDWGALQPLPSGLDYRWLDGSPKPILIAHALGESEQTSQNTIAALDRAVASGLKLLEIDVWLDTDGRLRCHHGPSKPLPWVPGECTLADALHAAAQHQAWLILDIKTDFPTAGAAIVQEFANDPAATQLIFQLYRPADVVLFSTWAKQLPLPGPIVTAYRARRSLEHIAGEAPRLGIHAFTMPLYRLAALNGAHPPMALLVHPVHDCDAVREAERFGMDGYYLSTQLLLELRSDCGLAARPSPNRLTSRRPANKT